MPFRFSGLCQLLNDLEKINLRDPPKLTKDREIDQTKTIELWFRVHRREIDSTDTDGAALLSCLLPERRSDRVYGIQETRLLKIIPRCLHLNSAKTKELYQWREPGNGDLGKCLERVLQVFDVEPKPGAPVMVEDIDHALHLIAARSRFSSPDVRASADYSLSIHDILKPILLRLNSSETKWLTRLILKDYSPVTLPSQQILRHFHFLLPALLRFQDSFSHAVALLRGPLLKYHSNPDVLSGSLFQREAMKLLSPKVGIKVGRPPYYKAWSIEHCMNMTLGKRWVIERKYDGEYCEIHVCLNKDSGFLRIFSKGGKDSTSDRKGLHSTIVKCLRIGQAECNFKSQCILIGEMVVFSKREQKIQEFHRIRKHIPRSGRYMGTDKDSPISKDEHLMVVFHDVLLVDDAVTMTMPTTKRREYLKQLIHKIPGYAVTSEWKLQDFSKSGAERVLMYQLVHAMANRLEGLVLKPADSPYCSFSSEDSQDNIGYFIKVKKDYLQELGGEKDVGDFAVIGSSFDPKVALRLGIKTLKFTHYYLGCVTNPEDIRFGRPVRYEVVASIEAGVCIPESELHALNIYAQFHNCDEFHGEKTVPSFSVDNLRDYNISCLFTEPCVVEMLGSGYDKPSNKNYFMLRHPRMLKFHSDRSWKDTVTFDELQSMAHKARKEPSQGKSEEIVNLLSKIKTRYDAKRMQISQPRRNPLAELSQALPQRSPPNSPSSGSDSLPPKRRPGHNDMENSNSKIKKSRIS
jgi:DNA ligase 4